MTVALRTLNHFLHRRVWRSARLTAEIPQYDLRLEVSPADVIGRHLYKYRRYEPELTTTLARHLELGSADLMVDIGANIGWYALLVTRLSEGRCRVIAFEPDPQNYALLKRNLALNGATQVQAFNLAVGDAADTLRLHRYGHDNAGRHSLLALHAGETIPVQVVALNEFWRTQQLPEGPIRLMKMDIEGYEVIALRGASEVLARCEWLLIEHSPAYLQQSGHGVAALVERLQVAGFTPFAPLGERLEPLSLDALRADTAQRDVLWRNTARTLSP